MLATTVFLVRHAAHDRQGRVLTGRMPDVRLGPEGREEIRALATRLAHETVAAIYASPMERAQETAGPIAEALGLDVTLSEGLNEIDFGEWTGASFDDLGGDARWRLWNTARARSSTPGGESMSAVQARVLAELSAWLERHPGQGVIAVSHADVIKAAVCGLLGLSLDRLDRFEVDPASITTLVTWRGGGKVLRLNEVAA